MFHINLQRKIVDLQHRNWIFLNSYILCVFLSVCIGGPLTSIRAVFHSNLQHQRMYQELNM